MEIPNGSTWKMDRRTHVCLMQSRWKQKWCKVLKYFSLESVHILRKKACPLPACMQGSSNFSVKGPHLIFLQIFLDRHFQSPFYIRIPIIMSLIWSFPITSGSQRQSLLTSRVPIRVLPYIRITLRVPPYIGVPINVPLITVMLTAWL